MLYFHKQRLVILSNTKTGSSALERVLSKTAAISTRFPPLLKHMSYDRFSKHLAPLIEATSGVKHDDLEFVMMMREPVSWLRSWYRYRQRESAHEGNSTADLTFEEFVRDYMRADPPQHARVGNQLSIMHRRDQVGVDRVFPYEEFDSFVDWLSERLGRTIDIPKINVSSAQPSTDLTPETLARLQQYLELPIAFHSRLSVDGAIVPEHHEIIAREFARRRSM